ncbi:ZIM-domain protein 2 [Artemisia annua]|uniref:Exocyst subunit Exo70 family protein n=1 Tax=Artemisia annua TaxID=35608 RepID=A0A2U1NP91_ARTAN|nr:ZIM-domain protein 2 [Artemisia annua]
MSSAKQFGTMKRSSVAQTCNQLSLFLKEKSCLKDLINANFDDTVNSTPTKRTIDLISNMENQGQKKVQTDKSMNVDDLTSEVTSARLVAVSETKTSQMTIFYNGQVVVFDNISADRAREVMLTAGSYGPNLVHEVDQPSHAQFLRNGLDLPIARRASLHKFLAKRKERAKAKGSTELREMIGDSFLKELTAKITQASTRYQRATWVGVLYCLRDEGLHATGSFSSGVPRSVLRERFKSFNAMFEEVHKMQTLWSIPDTQHREEIQISISEKVIPAYRSFLGRFRTHIENGKHPEYYIKYSVEDLETAVLDFFEGCEVSQLSRRRSL